MRAARLIKVCLRRLVPLLRGLASEGSLPPGDGYFSVWYVCTVSYGSMYYSFVICRWKLAYCL